MMEVDSLILLFNLTCWKIFYAGFVAYSRSFCGLRSTDSEYLFLFKAFLVSFFFFLFLFLFVFFLLLLLSEEFQIKRIAWAGVFQWVTEGSV